MSLRNALLLALVSSTVWCGGCGVSQFGSATPDESEEKTAPPVRAAATSATPLPTRPLPAATTPIAYTEVPITTAPAGAAAPAGTTPNMARRVTAAIAAATGAAGAVIGTATRAAAGAGGGAGSGATLDVARAMNQLYGGYNADTRRAQWNPTPAESDKLNFPGDPRTVYTRVLLAKPFPQGGAERFVLVTRTLPKAEGCDTCPPVIGGATFTKVNGVWRRDFESKIVTKMGVSGRAPDPELRQIGPDRYGVLFRWSHVNLGFVEETHVLIAETAGGVKEVLSLNTGGNNRAYCREKKLPEGDPECWSYTSKLEFVPGGDPNFHNLRVTTSGTRQTENGETVPVDERRSYFFADGFYRLQRAR